MIHLSQQQASSEAIRPGFDTYTLPPNDDDYSDEVQIGFDINFFGDTYSTLYVNNNGNVTFTGGLWEYTPFSINDASLPVIAPFFADVDTRPYYQSSAGTVSYGPGTVNGFPAFGVTWDAAGCFSRNAHLENTFQLILIDRTDRPEDAFDIEFNYGTIEWETGEASGGDDNCLGGQSARTGYSDGSGDSGTFFELTGSGINGAFLDANSVTGLVNNSYQSNEPGRYIFEVRSGEILVCPAGLEPANNGETCVDPNNIYCISRPVIGVNIRADHFPTATVTNFIGSSEDPWRLKLTGYADIPEIGRYYRVAGVYPNGFIDNNLDESVTGWLSEQVTSGDICDSSGLVSPERRDSELPVLDVDVDPIAAIGTATPTPFPPPTSTPPPDLSNVFSLPMTHPTNPIRLSRCGLHRDANPNAGITRGDLVLGLDMNPLGISGQAHELIVPARAEVVTVDTDIETGQEIGNFVGVRIEVSDLPIQVRARIAGTTVEGIPYNDSPADDRYESIPNTGGLDPAGAIYIGYGHMESVYPAVEPRRILEAGTAIGLSGETGLDASGNSSTFGKHLHVAVFYGEDEPQKLNPRPIAERDNYQWYFTAYDLGNNQGAVEFYGETVLVNPLVLWPSAQDGTQCPYWQILQTSEGNTQ